MCVCIGKVYLVDTGVRTPLLPDPLGSIASTGSPVVYHFSLAKVERTLNDLLQFLTTALDSLVETRDIRGVYAQPWPFKSAILKATFFAAGERLILERLENFSTLYFHTNKNLFSNSYSFLGPPWLVGLTLGF